MDFHWSRGEAEEVPMSWRREERERERESRKGKKLHGTTESLREAGRKGQVIRLDRSKKLVQKLQSTLACVFALGNWNNYSNGINLIISAYPLFAMQKNT